MLQRVEPIKITRGMKRGMKRALQRARRLFGRFAEVEILKYADPDYRFHVWCGHVGCEQHGGYGPTWDAAFRKIKEDNR